MKIIKTNETQSMLSKVPEITIYFWIIKVLCTTVGETASDFLDMNLGFGLSGTSILMGALLMIVLFFQFKAKKYIPSIYWLTVVLISVFGTLVTDNLTDNMGVPLEVSTIIFSIALVLTFSIWYAKEKTLDIHSIFTKRREAFYWLTILVTFALGTAAGDLMAESLGLGYLVTGIIVCAVIACMASAWKLKLDPVLSFWIIYIMTRPLGASLGDYLSQLQKYGGLGLGATVTSIIFTLAILLTVIFLSVTKRDLIARTSIKAEADTKRSIVLLQVVVIVCILAIASGTGYYWRHAKLQDEAENSAMSGSLDENSPSDVTTELPLGELSSFKEIEEDTLILLNAGDLPAAKSRVDDLEYTWDNAEAKLKPMNQEKWTEIDDSIDKVLRELRAVHPYSEACKAALESSLAILNGSQDETQNSDTSTLNAKDSITATPSSSAEDSSSIATKAATDGNSTSTSTKVLPLGDLSSFRKIEEDTQNLVNDGNLSAAKSRVDDLESAWDDAEAKLKPMNKTKWTEIDDSIDKVLSELRDKHQDAEACKVALKSSLALLN